MPVSVLPLFVLRCWLLICQFVAYTAFPSICQLCGTTVMSALVMQLWDFSATADHGPPIVAAHYSSAFVVRMTQSRFCILQAKTNCKISQVADAPCAVAALSQKAFGASNGCTTCMCACWLPRKWWPHCAMVTHARDVAQICCAGAA